MVINKHPNNYLCFFRKFVTLLHLRLFPIHLPNIIMIYKSYLCHYNFVLPTFNVWTQGTPHRGR